jgi:aminomethyltransferase
MESTARNMTPELQKTPLWQLHKDLGGKMVPFAGYDMPVQYDGMGVLKEHLHTRTAAGLFDVSHMGQAILTGNVDEIEKIVPGDIKGLAKGAMRYTVLLNDRGCIIDDLMVTRWDDKTLLLIVNAACKDKDFAYIREKIGSETKLEYLADRVLLALQGPKAEEVLADFAPEAVGLGFMTSIKKSDMYISRSGYTGEDGFEISLPAREGRHFARNLLQNPDVKLIGLGARDSLRLEAGLCLYGHDIDDTTTPAEANLKWVIPKRRREEANFPGAQEILVQIKNGTSRVRVGLQPDGRAPVREGTEIFSEDGRRIGMVTSGGFGPTADTPVAMGYVEKDFAKTGTKINAMLRGTPRPMTVAALPFVEHKYKKG